MSFLPIKVDFSKIKIPEGRKPYEATIEVNLSDKDGFPLNRLDVGTISTEDVSGIVIASNRCVMVAPQDAADIYCALSNFSYNMSISRYSSILDRIAEQFYVDEPSERIPPTISSEDTNEINIVKNQDLLNIGRLIFDTLQLRAYDEAYSGRVKDLRDSLGFSERDGRTDAGTLPLPMEREGMTAAQKANIYRILSDYRVRIRARLGDEHAYTKAVDAAMLSLGFGTPIDPMPSTTPSCPLSREGGFTDSDINAIRLFVQDNPNGKGAKYARAVLGMKEPEPETPKAPEFWEGETELERDQIRSRVTGNTADGKIYPAEGHNHFFADINGTLFSLVNRRLPEDVVSAHNSGIAIREETLRQARSLLAKYGKDWQHGHTNVSCPLAKAPEKTVCAADPFAFVEGMIGVISAGEPEQPQESPAENGPWVVVYGDARKLKFEGAFKGRDEAGLVAAYRKLRTHPCVRIISLREFTESFKAMTGLDIEA